MAVSQVDICNFALAKIGSESFITDINENTKPARFFRATYNLSRNSLLRQHLWRFARKRAVLAPLSTALDFESGYVFQLPSDCLRVVGTDADSEYAYERWFTEGDKKIVADTNVFNLVYIYEATDVSSYDPIFVELLASKLAHEICILLTNSTGLKNMVAEEMTRLKMLAAHVGSTEQDSQRFISETLIQAHT